MAGRGRSAHEPRGCAHLQGGCPSVTPAGSRPHHDIIALSFIPAHEENPL